MSRKVCADSTPGSFSNTTIIPGWSTRNSLPVSSPAWVSSTILSNSIPGKAGSSSTGASGRASTDSGSSGTGVGAGSSASAAVGEGPATGTSSSWGPRWRRSRTSWGGLGGRRQLLRWTLCTSREQERRKRHQGEGQAAGRYAGHRQPTKGPGQSPARSTRAATPCRPPL